MSTPREDRMREIDRGQIAQKLALEMLAGNMTALRGELQETKASLTALIAPLGVAVMGDNQVQGLRDRVRALESAAQNRRWLLGLIVATLIGLCVKVISEWIHDVSQTMQQTQSPLKTGKIDIPFAPPVSDG